MTKVVEAIYIDGSFKPDEALDLPDRQRVRLVVHPIVKLSPQERAEALQRLFKGLDEMDFHLQGPLPTRDELHERR